MRAGVVVLLSLATTGVSVGFNFLGRDFISSISEKNVPKFWQYLGYYTAGIALATPLFVLRDFYSSKLQLRWRQFMTSEFLGAAPFVPLPPLCRGGSGAVKLL